MNRFRPGRFALLAYFGIVLAACAGLKEPAHKAINTVETALNASAPEASKYTPDQFAEVEAKVADLKAAYDKQDYKTVLGLAPATLNAVNGLAPAVAAKKDDILTSLNGEWSVLAASVPQTLSAVQDRVAVLSKTKKLPPGINLPGARASINDAASLWSKAQGAFSSGNMNEAVSIAKQVKTKADGAAAALKLGIATS